MPTTTTAVNGTTTGSGDTCFPLLGYTYQTVSKWHKGEQIKITTQFDQNVQDDIAIRDESYIIVTYKDTIDAELHPYWPLEPSSKAFKISF